MHAQCISPLQIFAEVAILHPRADHGHVLSKARRRPEKWNDVGML